MLQVNREITQNELGLAACCMGPLLSKPLEAYLYSLRLR